MATVRVPGVRYACMVFVGLAALSMGGCPPPDGNGDGDGNGDDVAALVGTWAGTVTYTTGLVFGDTPGSSLAPVERQTTVTFAAESQSGSFGFATGVSGDIIDVPAADLLEVGDSVTVESTGGSRTITVTLTVTSISRTDTSFHLEMALALADSGSPNVEGTGTYTLDATVETDGTLTWTGTAEVQWANPQQPQVAFGLRTDVEGSLVKQ